jgi:hypothetical protein
MEFYTNLDAARRSARGEKGYTSTHKALEGIRNPENAALVRQANDELLTKALTPGVSHNDATIANMSRQFKNDEYIGLRLMPVIQQPHKSGTFFTYDKRSELAYPDDALGVRGSPNEITRSRGVDTFSTKGYGYKDFVDDSELQNQDAPLDDLADSTAGLLEALAFREELRIANIMTTAANYGGNTVALGSTVRWDDTGSTPIADIQAARNALWTGRGPGKIIAFTSLAVWTALQSNAQMQDMFKYSKDGLLQPAQWANYFGIDELLIGAARKDSANEGQTASYARVWGDVFGLVRVAATPSVRNASFGYTFRFGQIDTAQVFDQMIGTKGGWWTKASVDEVHKVVAPETSYLITTVIG